MTMPVLVVGFLIAALLVGEIVDELRTGKLLARGWKVYAERESNSMLYWSSVALQTLVTLFVIAIMGLVIVKPEN